MGKRKTKKSRKRRSRPRQHNPTDSKDVQFYEVPNPLEAVTPEQMAQLVAKMTATMQSDFEDSLEKLNDVLLQANPTTLLAMHSVYDLLVTRETNSDQLASAEIHQFHVELLQALVLRYPLEDYRSIFVDPEIFEITQELLQTLSLTFTLKHEGNSTHHEDQSEKARRLSQQIMRLGTQALRNWGYPTQMLRTTKDLFTPLEPSIQDLHGFTVSSMVDFHLRITLEVEERLRDRCLKLARVFKSNSVEELWRQYHAEFPELTGTPDDVLNSFPDLNVDQSKVLVLNHQEHLFSQSFTFTMDELMSLFPEDISTDTLKKHLLSYSCSFGDLNDFPIEHTFLSNPVWLRPFIYLDSEKFYLPVPGLLHSFVLQHAELLLQPSESLKKAYYARRGQFLEEQLESLFKETLPMAKVVRGIQFRDSSNELFENDLLVVLGSHALVIEAKAGTISPPARRGAPYRLDDTFQKLIVDAAIQSDRFARLLLEATESIEFPTKHGESAFIDAGRIRIASRLTVTLEDVANLRLSPTSPLIPKGLTLPPAVPLADLETVLSLFSYPSEVFYYFMRRQEIELSLNYFGDELDLMGYYLSTGFSFSEAQFVGTHVTLTGLSEPIDEHLMRLEAGKKSERPRRELSRLWREILKRLQMRKPSGWIDLSCRLLEFDLAKQEEVEAAARELKRRVRSRQGLADKFNINWVISNRGTLLISIAFKEVPRKRRDEIASRCATSLMEEHDITQAIVIGHDVLVQGKRPYAFLAMHVPDSSSMASESL